MSSAALVVQGQGAQPQPEDEHTGLPYIDSISPEEQAVVERLLQEEVGCLPVCLPAPLIITQQSIHAPLRSVENWAVLAVWIKAEDNLQQAQKLSDNSMLYSFGCCAAGSKRSKAAWGLPERAPAHATDQVPGALACGTHLQALVLTSHSSSVR